MIAAARDRDKRTAGCAIQRAFDDNGNGNGDAQEQSADTTNGDGSIAIEQEPAREVEPLRPGLDDERASMLAEELMTPDARPTPSDLLLPDGPGPAALPLPKVGLNLMPRLDSLD